MADVLVVDDDVDVSEALEELLRDEGHVVRVAHDGVEGMAALDERRPDLVLLDLEMPRLSGSAMAYRMFLHNAGWEHIPLILLSGRMDVKEIAATLGTEYYLAKPYSFTHVLDLIARATREHAAPRPRTRELAAIVR